MLLKMNYTSIFVDFRMICHLNYKAVSNNDKVLTICIYFIIRVKKKPFFTFFFFVSLPHKNFAVCSQYI